MLFRINQFGDVLLSFIFHVLAFLGDCFALIKCEFGYDVKNWSCMNFEQLSHVLNICIGLCLFAVVFVIIGG